eukprot:COSAG05_NODE_2009_length_3706_cov_2.105905_1_plen_56_part_00
MHLCPGRYELAVDRRKRKAASFLEKVQEGSIPAGGSGGSGGEGVTLPPIVSGKGT